MVDIWSQESDGQWRRRAIMQRQVMLHTAAAGEPAAPEACSQEESMSDSQGLEQDRDSGAAAGHVEEVVVAQADIEGQSRWVLLAPCTVRVLRNGHELALGLCVLEDRDEIVLCPGNRLTRFYFAAQDKGEIGRAPASLPAPCPRCKDAIVSGSPAVQCTACGAWHHQRDERPCWTYAPRCAACHHQSTVLSDSPSWSPTHL